MLGRVQQLHQLWQHLGPQWLVYRLSYATQIRTGALRRKMPATEYNEQPLDGFLTNKSLADPENYLEYRRGQGPRFFFSPDQRAEYLPYFKSWDVETRPSVEFSDNLDRGKLHYFGGESVDAGYPPSWHANPLTGEQAPAGLHWSEIGDFEHGDIKVIWEPSRFGFTFALVRAFWRTGDERYAEMFWRLVEDWREHNPPQLGVNWKCGQEITFRVMAWCFGLYGFLSAKATTPDRAASMAQIIAISATRIKANLEYALSQQNNHGISEAVGLWTIGLLFPELIQADLWEEKGRQALESQAQTLIYVDGAFSQHSANYHRLMLHAYVWALRLGEIANQPLTNELKKHIKVAGEFLYEIQDEMTGRVPLYGQNDGALILPLNNCDYQDFRPVIQATLALTTGLRRYSPGPWDEDLLWLFGPKALTSPLHPKERADFVAKQGGCYVIRSQNGFAFVRCGSFRHRPAQADLLHLDLWWRGQNIALDAGTFSYNAAPPWDDPLSCTAYHNTVIVDGRNQMERVGRFLWLPWARGSVQSWQRSREGHLAYWEGSHNGYERLTGPAVHRRSLVQVAEHWLVLDRITSETEHEHRLHWLLMDVPYESDDCAKQLTLKTPAGPYRIEVGASNPSVSSIVRADSGSARGWRSRYYNHREPALSLALTARSKILNFWTVFGAEPFTLTASDHVLQLLTDRYQAKLDLQIDDNSRPLVTSITLDGAIQDHLEIG